MNKFTTGLCALGLFAPFAANATLLTFDDAITGATSYTFDADGDTIDDVIFSTTDPLGFNTAGPGANMSHIDEPGLEGTTLLSPDLRVDFLIGAIDELSFGFATNNSQDDADGVTFSIYNSGGGLLASTNVLSAYTLVGGVTQSSFPEAYVNIAFSGVAAYATFDFSDNLASRYIIDNFEGTFGSTDPIPTPAPSVLTLIGLGILCFGAARKTRKVRKL